MKQLNKLFNILNIIAIIVLQRLVIENQIYTLGRLGYFFERLVIGIIILITLLQVFINMISGIKNIRNKEKRIGIINFLISGILGISAIFEIVKIKINVNGELFFLINGILYLIAIILSLSNLIINRKNSDVNKKKNITILFIIMIIGYIMISAIPNMLVRLNIKQFEKVVAILSQEPETKLIVYHEKDVYKIFDINGNLISTNNYEYVDCWEITVNNKDICLIAAKDATGLWMINYKGEKVEEIYTLFEKADTYFLNRFVDELQGLGYSISIDNEISLNEMEIDLTKIDETKSIQNKVYFINNIRADISLLVEFNYNEIKEEKNNLFLIKYKKHLERRDSNELSDFEELYSYKKKYYLINNRTKEKIQLDCENIIFADVRYGSLEVDTYTNGYIPYYDEDTSGYFNLEGEKFSVDSKYIVFDTLEKYRILKNIMTDDYYINFYNQEDKMINIGSNIEDYGNEFVDTTSYTYVINNDTVKKLSENKKQYVTFLNIDKVPFFSNIFRSIYF